MISPDAFRRALTLQCKRLGTSKRELCRRAKVDPTTINPSKSRVREERGGLGLPSLDIINRLERACGLEPLGLLLLARDLDRS
jgi:hypothetical protein